MMTKSLSFLSLYCILSLLFLAWPKSAYAAILFEDHFDRNDLTGWTVFRNENWVNPLSPCMNNDQPAVWQILLQRLGIVIDGSGCFTDIIPTFFQLQGDQGYAYSFDMTMPESMDMDRNYLLRNVSLTDWYSMKIINDSFFLEKQVQGQGWNVAGSSTRYPFVANTTYHFRNEIYQDHKIKIFINNQLVLDFTDAAPYLTGGTIGFRASSGAIPRSVSWFDNAIVETLTEKQVLAVPYFSQRDMQWKNQEYDHASQWSSTQTTIERWGCALTTAVMILRYYGIDTTPQNTPLTPSSLNTWLQSQTDGYVGNGFVNWIALTRLTKIFNKTHPEAPLLEYKRKEDDQNLLQQELAAQRPAILQVPGHFVVARGKNTDDSVAILDPADQMKTSLSAYNNTFASMRTFIPTHTNLSYLLVAYDPSLHLTLQKEGIEIETFMEEPFQDPISGNQEGQHEFAMQQIAMPPDGDYTIQISQEFVGLFEFSLYTYTKEGEVQVFQQSGIADGNPQTYTLHYSQDATSYVEKVVTTSTLLQTITRLRQMLYIQKAYPHHKLYQVAEYLHQYREENEVYRRYLHLIQYTFNTFTDYLTPRGQQILQDEIANLKREGEI